MARIEVYSGIVELLSGRATAGQDAVSRQEIAQAFPVSRATLTRYLSGSVAIRRYANMYENDMSD